MRTTRNIEINTIVKSCIKKDVKAQRKLYDILFDTVFHSMKNFGFDKQTMEDLIQESFVKLFLNLKKYDSTKSSILTWSSILSRRIAINFLRGKANKKGIVVEINERIQMISNHTEVDFLAMDIVLEAIDGLPRNYKDVFELYIFQGLDHTSISKELSISISSSRVYLARARKQIQKILIEHGIGPNNVVDYSKSLIIEQHLLKDQRS